MKVWFKVVCNNTRELSTAIAFMLDLKATFLINLCEGWQQSTKLTLSQISSVNHVFAQDLSYSSLGGILGFYRLQASFHNLEYTLKVCGPPGIATYLKSFRFMGKNEPLKLYTRTFANNIGNSIPVHLTTKPVKLNNLSVYAILAGGKKDEPYHISYLIQPSIRWTGMRPEIVDKLRLTVQEIGDLSNNQSVKLMNGSTLEPKELFENYEKPPAALFLSVPEISYLDTLKKSPILNTYISSFAKESNKVGIVYHSTAASALSDPTYVNFVSKFGRETMHVIDCKEINSSSPTRQINAAFNRLLYHCNNKLFPKDFLGNIPNFPNLQMKDKVLSAFASKGITPEWSVAGGNYHLFPRIEANISKSTADKASLDKAISLSINRLKSDNSCSTTKESCESFKNTWKYTREPHFIMLGTGAPSTPLTHSNSGIYMSIPVQGQKAKYNGILIDCGEGTYGQLLDHCNAFNELKERLSALRVIFASHWHADHYSGIVTMLKECNDSGNDGPIYIVAPYLIMRNIMIGISISKVKNAERIKFICCNFLNPDSTLHYNFPANSPNVPASSLTKDQADMLVKELYSSTKDEEVREFWNYLEENMGIKVFHTFETDHVIDSYGLVIQGPDWKVAYSGDTSPCTTLENFAKGADLLIHECTLTNDKGKAFITKHTSLPEVKEIIDKVKPRRTILTHFANKVINITAFPKEFIASEMFPAVDHLRFYLSDTEWMPRTVPLIQKAFKHAEKTFHIL